MSERRTFARKHLIFHLKVFDASKTELMGQAVDISPDGLKMVSAHRLEVGKAHAIAIELPQGVDKREYMEIEAEAVWSQEDINPGLYITGFKFPARSPEEREDLNVRIQGLFREYVF